MKAYLHFDSNHFLLTFLQPEAIKINGGNPEILAVDYQLFKELKDGHAKFKEVMKLFVKWKDKD